MKGYDVVIAGAGPAGCSAAIFLARKGLSVALCDKARFPREKACGDGLTSASTRLLHALGVTELLRERLGEPSPFHGVTIVSPFGTVVSGGTECPELERRCFVVPRMVLDDCLVSCAREHSSITLMEGVAVDGLLRQGDRVTGLSTSAGALPGTCVVGADGSYSKVAGSMGLLNRDRRHQGFAIRAYFSEVPVLERYIELHYEKYLLPGYGWFFPVGEHRVNVGVGIMPRFTDQRGARRLFEKFVRESPRVARRLGGAVMEKGSLRAWPLPSGSFTAPRGRENVLLVGDAGSLVDPVTGEGISYALQSGRYAAEAIAGALGAGDASQAFGRYDPLWKNDFQNRVYRAGYALQPLLANEFVVEALIRHVSLRRQWADLLGDVISQKRPRHELLHLFNPFF